MLQRKENLAFVQLRSADSIYTGMSSGSIAFGETGATFSFNFDLPTAEESAAIIALRHEIKVELKELEGWPELCHEYKLVRFLRG